MRSSPALPRLGVNIDHVATVRNARGGSLPDPVRAAELAIKAGADGITAHLREDRRHIRDEDIARLMATITKPLNFEMAVTEEMVGIALKTKPHAACLVPEKRSERTTEGGLDVVGGFATIKPEVERLKAAGIRVSLFIEPDLAAIDAALRLGAPVVELHTGAWCDALSHGQQDAAQHHYNRLVEGARVGAEQGLEIHVGHGLDYETAEVMAALPQVMELNIGHFMMGEAIFVGLEQVIGLMRAAIARGVAKRDVAKRGGAGA
jgi:pyridoxine 5-phosphate synthase